MAKFTRLPDRIITELSLEEAATLAIVCRRVGGSPDTSPRGYTDRIAEALAAMGLDAGDGYVVGNCNKVWLNEDTTFRPMTINEAWKLYTGRDLK